MLLRLWEQKNSANERGSALVAVLGVMVVGLLLTTLVASSVVRAFGSSTSSRAAMQSHAAADAGVAAARAGLYTLGNCASQPTPGKYVSSGSLVYTATVLFDSGSGFTAGCPTSTTTRVQIVSTGKAQSMGVAGVTGGNTRTVEATLNYLTPGPKPSGPAIVLYRGGDVNANSSFDLSESGGLVIQHGDLTCSKPNTTINGSVQIGGNLLFSANHCRITGDASVSGAAVLGTGTIGGCLSSASGGPYTPPQVGSCPSATTIKPAPPWTDVAYTPTDWVASSGAAFQVTTLITPAACTLSTGDLGGTPSGSGLILNMLGCATGPIVGQNQTFSLTSDVVIFANQFDFSSVNGLTFQSKDSSVHKLWFVTPDTVKDSQPTCGVNQGPFNTKNNLSAGNVIVTTNAIQAMIYTPCAFLAANGFVLNGQIYAGQLSVLQNNPQFTFAQIGIAGCDLSTGTCSPSPPSLPKPGSVISNRDLDGG